MNVPAPSPPNLCYPPVIDPQAYKALRTRALHRYRGAPNKHHYYLRGKALLDPVYERVLAEISPNATVTDLGCGLGFIEALLIERGHQAALTAVEWDADKAATAAEATKLTIARSDVFTTRVTPADCVLLLDVLHYRNEVEQDALLWRAWAATRDKLIVRELDADSRSAVTQGIERWWVKRGWNKAAATHFRSATAIEAQLTTMGARVTRTVADAPGLRGNVLWIAQRDHRAP